jgi:hypothetical protein
VDSPCRIRASSNRIGASAPTCAYVGLTAISRLPAAISSTESTSPPRRPARSVNPAINSPPSGRKKNPTAKIASVPSSADTLELLGKNCPAKNTEKIAYACQSNHSRVLPSSVANSERRIPG